MKTYLSIFFLLVSTCLLGQSIKRIDGTQYSADSLNAKIEHLMKSANVTGVAVSVFNNNKAVFSKTFGLANVPKNIPLEKSSVLYAASFKKLPTLIHEQNSYAGITNKILKDKVNKICVAYDNMEKFFPANKLVKTGNPIRQDLMDVTSKRKEAIDFFKLNSNKKTVLVIGGSLGARTINESVFEGLEKLKAANINLIWQTGKNFNKVNSNKEILNSKKEGNVLENNSSLEFRISDFIYEMDLAYAAADVVISRAGALSISELCLVGKPVVLVPSPNVAEDHQTQNALALVNKNAAILVKDVDARETLIDEILKLLADEQKQESLKQNIVKLGRKDAADRIAEEVIKLID